MIQQIIYVKIRTVPTKGGTEMRLTPTSRQKEDTLSAENFKTIIKLGKSGPAFHYCNT